MSPLKNVSTSAGIECVLSTQKLHNYSFLQQIISCTETRQKIMPSDRSQCPEQIPAGPNFQNGNSRNNQKFSYKRGVAGLNRPHRCAFPYTNAQRISTLASLSCARSNISVSSTAISISDRSPRIHMSCKRSKAHSSILRNSNSTVLG